VRITGSLVRRITRAAGLVVAAALALLPSSALAGPGDLDAAFGAGGRLTAQFGLGDHEQSSHALAMAVAPDGRIVVAGTATDPDLHPAFLVARFTPDGRADDTFGGGGHTLIQAGAAPIPYAQATAVGIAPDGGIVVAGNINDSPGHFAAGLVRLLPDGSLDTSFATEGVARVQLGGVASQVLALGIDASGRILVAGDTDDGNGRPALALARFLPGGTFDPSFGTGGLSVVQLGAGPDLFSAGTAIQVLPGGGVLVAGEASDARGNQQIALLRFTQAGFVDQSFAARGVARMQMGSGVNGLSTARALTLAPDGGILVAGEATGPGADEQLALLRFLPSGRLDTRFASRGRLRVQLGTGDAPLSTARSLAIASHGQILVSGEATDDIGDGTTLIARFSARGVLDRSFGTLGAARRQFGGAAPGHRFSAIRSSAVVAGSRLLVAGYATDPTEDDQVFLGRFLDGRRAVALVDATEVPLVDGRARIPLLCVGSPTERCRGRLALTMPTSTAPGSGRKGRKPLVVGTARFRLVASKTDVVNVSLTPRARKRFARKGHLDAQWRITSVDRAGNRSSLVVPLRIVSAG
jgi:uncharacterized delta-60 repeat protein